MAVNLASPGVNVREVDLTLGGIVPGAQNIGAIAGPFEKGPVDEPVLIENEQQLLDVFGKPKLTDDQYEYWMSASNYLSYGGALRVVRTNTTAGSGLLQSANVASVGSGSTNLQIKSFSDYENNHSTDTEWLYATKSPGSWGNNLKVCLIDNLADQIISGINTTSINVAGFSTFTTLNDVAIGIVTDRITGINTSGITLNMVFDASPSGAIILGTEIISISSEDAGTIVFSPASTNTELVVENLGIGTEITNVVSRPIQVGYAVTQSLAGKTGIEGSTVVTYNGYLRGLVTEVKTGEISVKITDRVDINGVSYPVNYLNPGDANSNVSNLTSFSFDSIRNQNLFVGIGSTNPINTSYNIEDITITDWYSNQTLNLENSTLYWRSIAPKPGTSQYATERNSTNDEVHVVIVDDTGSVTGISGNILEKHISLSKASDGRVSPSQPIYYKEYISQNSQYVFSGGSPSGVSVDLVSTGVGSSTFTLVNDIWGTTTQGKRFNCVGAKTYNLSGGTDYSGAGSIGGYSISNSNVITSYEIFNNQAEYELNYIINGPSGGATIYEAQAKANSIIAIAENRKDCVAVISPYKSGIVNLSNSTTQTNNIIQFFSSLTSSSYAIFDSGYKYTLDRFNNKFVYIPCNSDVAGLLAKTATNNYPWFSPAGSSRGALNNVIKLAYNPTQIQRDQLYSNRINPIISSPGAGFILFGDKTALSYSSAFDRINVRMLFLTIEESIREAARAQLFEFNDAITRANFVNIVEPYLRDIRAKRGINEFLIICDESNNTPDIIDSNEFKADIYVKPARSINFIGLTFVATRTGVSFSEIVGTV